MCFRPLALLLSIGLLSGCASVSEDSGFSDVNRLVSERTGERVQWNRNSADDQAATTAVQDLLKSPLSVDATVQIALLNNRELQATYEDLGISQADLVQAGLLKNPLFSFSRLAGGNLVDMTLSIEFDFINLLFTPSRAGIVASQFEETKLRVADAVLKTAMDVKTAYYAALASEQSIEMLQKVTKSTEMAAEIASRQYDAGTTNRRERDRQQAFYADTLARLIKCRAENAAQRERLTRLMGLWGTDIDWALPQHLPELPKKIPNRNDLETLAVNRRLDLLAVRKSTETFAKTLGITADTRFLTDADVGVSRESQTDQPTDIGPTLMLGLPIFDQGQARMARAEAQYKQSHARLYSMTVNARSEVREAYASLAGAYGVAKLQRKTILPLKNNILEETKLRYNGMLEGIYDLLVDAREQVIAGQTYIDALKDYWVAHAELERATGGTLPQEQNTTAPSSTPAPESAEPAPTVGHEHHAS